MAVATSQLENVLLEDLKENMIIMRYTKFSKRFQPMDDISCKWLQYNFKGVKTIIKRKDKKYDAPIEKVQAGDSIMELHTFPESLKKSVFAVFLVAGNAIRRYRFCYFHFIMA